MFFKHLLASSFTLITVICIGIGGFILWNDTFGDNNPDIIRGFKLVNYECVGETHTYLIYVDRLGYVKAMTHLPNCGFCMTRTK